jgi:formylglycine-generating enzyme required for sulfatase activity
MPRLPLRPVTLALAGVWCLSLASFATSETSELVRIAGGTSVMGRDGGPAEEAPAHRLVLSAFRIQPRKVTNAEFAAFLNASGPRGPDGRRYDDDDADARIHRRDGRWIADAGFEHHPAVEVSWFGARDFCAWKGWRLPSEAEWERAARGADGRPYPWGSTAPTAERAVFGRAYNATERGDARPAGRTPEGIEDLLGNLREWTATALVPYPWVRTAFTGAERVVVRGASHDDPAESLSATRRRDYDRRGAAAGHHHVGFRCASDENSGGRTR